MDAIHEHGKLAIRWALRRWVERGGVWGPWCDQGPNILLDTGSAEALDIIFGTGAPTVFNAANARIGAGSDATAADATQTDLQSALGWQGMDGGYPVRVGTTTYLRATFAAGVATGGWVELAADNRAAAGTIVLNRKVLSVTWTKAAGDVFQALAAVTLA